MKKLKFEEIHINCIRHKHINEDIIEKINS